MTLRLPTIRRRFPAGLGAALAVGVGVLLFFTFMVEGLAYLGWRLSGAGKVSLPQIAAQPAPERHPKAAIRTHGVEEWPATRARAFRQAPMLDDAVQNGKIPPVAERLPKDPQVVVPPEQNGPYGGTWRRYGTDPADIQTYVVHRLPYPNLLRWSPMGDRLLPNVITRWTIEDNARTYTFWIRRGMRWSDGEPFTTGDILFWFQSVLQNKELTPGIPREFKRGGKLMTLRPLGDYAFQVRFAEPNGRFLQNMAAMPGYEMINYPAHYLRRFHADFVSKKTLEGEARKIGKDHWYQLFQDQCDWQNPDCPRLWPWIVKDPPPARPIVLVRNPYYWKVDPDGNQLPYIDRIHFDIFDPETINMRAINGDIGMQNRHIKFENYPLFMEHAEQGSYRVLHWIDTGGGTNILAPNMNSKDPIKHVLFNDRRFRIALSLAINRNEINEACYFGIGVPRQVAPPPTSEFYDAKYASAYIQHDPREANRLLDELGLDQRNAEGIRLRKDGKPLQIQIDTIAMTGNLPALELVAEYWRAVGIKAEVKVLARQLFYQRKSALMHDIGVWYGADELNPLLDPRWFFPWNAESIQGIAYANWFRSNGKKGEQPPEEIRQCMDLWRQIEVTPDLEAQRKLFMRIIDLNRQNLWVIGTIGEIPAIYIVNDRFRNVPEVAVSGWQFRGPANTAPECYAIGKE